MIRLPDLQERRVAIIEGEYRYWLHQRLPRGKGVTVFNMLNPSRADARRNDPTARRCIDFATAWGSELVVLVNMFAARSPDPDDLLEHDAPEGFYNRGYIEHAARLVRKMGGQYVVAWGGHSIARLQAPSLMAFIRACGATPMHLGLTKEGQPRHPLYLNSNQELLAYGKW